MRKAGILAILLLAASLCGVAVAARDVYDLHDQVTLTEASVWGDKSAAEDLTLNLRNGYRDRILWETGAPLGELASTSTEYRFSNSRILEERSREYSGIGLDSSIDTAFYHEEIEHESYAQGITRAYQELAGIVGPGEEKEKEIFLKDYIDFYPVSVTADMPGTNFSIGSSRFLSEQPELGTENDVAKKISAFFKIPVLPEERWEISLGKNESGRISNMGNSSTEGDKYYMWTYSVVAEDACYFTIENRSYEGRVMDMSHIPGGYGIYRLPYQEPRYDESGQKIMSADADSLAMVYPLDPEIDVMYLHLSEDGKRLLLHAVENGMYVLTVIDRVTMETLQKLPIMPYGENDASQLYDEGDFIVTMIYGETPLTAVVVEQDEAGLYSLAYTVPLSHEDWPSVPFYDVALDFDGERLAMTGILEREEEHFRDDTCNPFVAVYDRSGMLYYGEYKNSLDAGFMTNSHSFHCLPYGMEAIEISFDD